MIILRRLTMIAIGILVGIICVEFLLRGAGFVYEILNKPPEKSDTEFSVFCLGESTTAGVGAAKPLEQGYPAQLEEMLGAYCGARRPRCFFDQTIGQNSSEILLKLPRYLAEYDPDLLIIMVGANNWWNLRKTNPLLFSHNRVVSRTTLGILSFLDNFRIWNVVKRSGFGPSIYESRWDYDWPEGKPVSDLATEVENEFGNDIWNLFYEITLHDLQEMVRLSLDRGVKVIVATYPMTGGETWAAQKFASDESGCFFVDNHEAFQKLDDVQQFLSADGWHPNERGYTIVAENFFSCIVENDLMNCGSAPLD